MGVISYCYARAYVIAVVSLALIALSCKTRTHTIEPTVVSLSPAMTEIIFALGAQEHLAGVTTYCTHPVEARDIYNVGDFSNPSLERIIACKPDLVIVNTPEQHRIAKQLKQLDIEVFESAPTSLTDVYAEITALGKRLNAAQVAESIVTAMQEVITPVHTSSKRVYVELSPRPLITIGSNTFLNEMIDLAGGTNIFSDRIKAYPVISQESVISRDPEIIIILHPEPFTKRVGWENITAIRNNNAYTEINQDHLLRPGPRLVIGYKALRNIISD